MPARKVRGFTLIELLVVIAIIAILAAILFPVFLSAKKSAARSACLNNFKQMGSAVSMYVDDHCGRFPCAQQSAKPAEIPASDWYAPPPGSYVAVACVWTFRQYCKSAQMWVCPAGARVRWGASKYDYPAGRSYDATWPQLGGWIKAPGMGQVFCNYAAYAFCHHSCSGFDDHPKPYPLPADMYDRDPDPLCAEGKTPIEFYQQCTTHVPRYNPWLINDAYDPGAGRRFYPHKGGIAGIFYDGHVQWYKDNRFRE